MVCTNRRSVIDSDLRIKGQLPDIGGPSALTKEVRDGAQLLFDRGGSQPEQQHAQGGGRLENLVQLEVLVIGDEQIVVLIGLGHQRAVLGALQTLIFDVIDVVAE